MSDAPAYMLANLVINDVDEYRKYEKGFFPILKRFGGEFLTFDDQPHTFEGTTPPEGRLILFKFPSANVAQAWFDDPEYQTLSSHRRAGTIIKCLTLIHGLPPRV